MINVDKQGCISITTSLSTMLLKSVYNSFKKVISKVSDYVNMQLKKNKIS